MVKDRGVPQKWPSCETSGANLLQCVDPKIEGSAFSPKNVDKTIIYCYTLAILCFICAHFSTKSCHIRYCQIHNIIYVNMAKIL